MKSPEQRLKSIMDQMNENIELIESCELEFEDVNLLTGYNKLEVYETATFLLTWASVIGFTMVKSPYLVPSLLTAFAGYFGKKSYFEYSDTFEFARKLKKDEVIFNENTAGKYKEKMLDDSIKEANKKLQYTFASSFAAGFLANYMSDIANSTGDVVSIYPTLGVVAGITLAKLGYDSTKELFECETEVDNRIEENTDYGTEIALDKDLRRIYFEKRDELEEFYESGVFETIDEEIMIWCDVLIPQEQNLDNDSYKMCENEL